MDIRTLVIKLALSALLLPHISHAQTNEFDVSGGLENVTFTPIVTGAQVYTTKTQDDGKVLIGGTFTHVNGKNRNGLARLLENGSLDPAFKTVKLNGATGVRHIDILPNGRLLLGLSTPFVRGLTPGGDNPTIKSIIKLNSDGTIDNQFSSDLLGGGVSTIVPQNDEYSLIGGFFTTPYGARSIARISTKTGKIDPSFSAFINDSHPSVTDIEILDDGKILFCGGSISRVAGKKRRGIARLNSDGSLDEEFNLQVSGSIEYISNMQRIQGNKILIFGLFSTLMGVAKRNHALLNIDGSLINEFPSNTSLLSQSPLPQILDARENGDMLIVTTRFRVGASISNSYTYQKIRIDGTVDPDFKPAVRLGNIRADYSSIQNDGGVLLGTRINLGTKQGLAPSTVNGDLIQTRLFKISETGRTEGLEPPCVYAKTKNGRILPLCL